MRVAIRVDASQLMGTGHLRRCMALAHALVNLGASVWLVCRPLDVVASSILKGVPYPVLWLQAPDSSTLYCANSTDDPLPPHSDWAGVSWAHDAQEVVDCLRVINPQWIFLDHYAFDAHWHAQVREKLGCQIAVMDDLGDRTLQPDLLIDQNWSEDHGVKYAQQINPKLLGNLRVLGGPRFALLSAAYRNADGYQFHPQVRSMGIFMGGTDPFGASKVVLAVCRSEVGFSGPIEVVSTSANLHLADLREACATSANTTLTLDEPDLAAFFARHDLHIGAGGGATWERCHMGAPTVALVIADNQIVVVPALERLGVLRAATLPALRVSITHVAGGHSLQPLAQVVRQLLDDPEARRKLSDLASRLVDARGAQRVALSLMRDMLFVRPATMADARLLYGWRNDEAVRSVSLQTAEIAYEGHEQWMQSVLGDPMRHLLVGQVGTLAVGCIRFDSSAQNEMQVSLYLDPKLQGLGLGTRLLLAGERYLFKRIMLALTFKADVVPGNAASQQLFIRCGYSGGPLSFEKHAVIQP
jgi:UDP-2,4-diacetamido-2,4,6-trideoxy-beta-L-altropyranose hydrolase